MKTILRIALALVILLPTGLAAGAQVPLPQEEKTIQGIPVSDYYLMPEFTDGMIFFEGQGPAQGKLNICTLDHTLRFLDRDGKELAAKDEDAIVKVRIDTVFFLRSQGYYYRLFPVNPEAGAALLKEVSIRREVKQGAYGTSSETSSVKEYDIIYADGVAYGIDRQYPYKVSETVALYKGNKVMALSKKNFRKLFPEKKAEIDAYFQAGHPLPESLEETLALLRQFEE